MIEFRRGEDTSDDIKIDHVIPLNYAWQELRMAGRCLAVDRRAARELRQRPD
jgi:hypothetical protein